MPSRLQASKADKSETEALKAENARLKDRADKAEKENTKILRENAEIKARLEKIEKALYSK